MIETIRNIRQGFKDEIYNWKEMFRADSIKTGVVVSIIASEDNPEKVKVVYFKGQQCKVKNVIHYVADWSWSSINVIDQQKIEIGDTVIVDVSLFSNTKIKKPDNILPFDTLE